MNNDSGAIVVAKKIVKERLLAPTTASFNNEKVLDRKGNLFLVYMTVDAQNVYGAKIRSYYLVVLEVTSDGTYYDSRTFAAQELREPPDSMEIDATKYANNWDNWKYH
jgi:hypothetical protein